MEILNQINLEALRLFFNFLNELPLYKFIIFIIFIGFLYTIGRYFRYIEKKESKEEYIKLLGNIKLELEKENKKLKNKVKDLIKK